MCDISKAFDRVYHPALLHKLAYAGITGQLLAWFHSYLRNRTQRVVINGGASSWGNIEAGVPQGSVLGPLLFLIYINDIVDIIHTNVRLFADDTVLYVTVDNPDIAAEEMNDDLLSVSEWSSEWLLTFNPDKTKEMIISRKRQTRYHPNLMYEGKLIGNVQEHKHLGLLLKSDLTWSSHIKNVCTRAMKMVCILRSLQYKLNRRSLEILYFSFIRPILEYGNVVFGNCSSEDEENLENVQLAAARAVTGARRYTSHEQIYSETGWDTLATRRKNHKLVIMYKIVNKIAPQYLQNLLPQTVNDRSKYNVRSNSKLTVIPARTVSFGKSFFPSTVRLWNELPVATRKSESVEEFKSKLQSNKTKVNNLFYIGNRKENIILAQLRMGSSSLNADLFKIRVVASPTCTCGSGNEDVFHYFLECPLYAAQRNALQNVVIPHTCFTVRSLLHGPEKCQNIIKTEIYEAVIKFIQDTNRFT